ncbi:MAG: hypothetical protein JWM16_1034 [Verrucomicrobiales bacterium]|nr:hypothetical protein [Verrucomicrobiales bacterium]
MNFDALPLAPLARLTLAFAYSTSSIVRVSALSVHIRVIRGHLLLFLVVPPGLQQFLPLSIVLPMRKHIKNTMMLMAGLCWWAAALLWSSNRESNR